MSEVDRWKISPEELESRQKLKKVKEQIEARPTSLECPYCGGLNAEGLPFCCDTLRHAVIAILTGKRMEKIQEAQSRYVN